MRTNGFAQVQHAPLYSLCIACAAAAVACVHSADGRSEVKRIAEAAWQTNQRARH
jgi:hypothetical protein